MRISPKNRRHLVRILTVTICWTAFWVFVHIHETLFLGNFPGIMESSFLSDYSLSKAALSGLITGPSSGILFGVLEEYYFSDKFKRRTFLSIILVKSGIYLILIVFISLLSSILFNSVLAGRSITDPIVWQEVYLYMTEASFLNVLLIGASIIILTIFLLEVSNKYGPGNLWKFITGQYYHPKEETRVFMFIDLRDSTTIAEDIGHIMYFEFIKEFFDDITEPILENDGEIYQYVGDEVVITWKEKKGAGAIQCFNQIKEVIHKRSTWYEEKFGVAPSLQGGLSYWSSHYRGDRDNKERDYLFR